MFFKYALLNEARDRATRPVSLVRGHSSAGRAPAWHAGGQRFDPAWLHQFSAPAAELTFHHRQRKIGGAKRPSMPRDSDLRHAGGAGGQPAHFKATAKLFPENLTRKLVAKRPAFAREAQRRLPRRSPKAKADWLPQATARQAGHREGAQAAKLRAAERQTYPSAFEHGKIGGPKRPA